MDVVLVLAIILGAFALFLWLVDTPRRNDYYRELRSFKNKWIETGSPEGS